MCENSFVLVYFITTVTRSKKTDVEKYEKLKNSKIWGYKDGVCNFPKYARLDIELLNEKNNVIDTHNEVYGEPFLKAQCAKMEEKILNEIEEAELTVHIENFWGGNRKKTIKIPINKCTKQVKPTKTKAKKDQTQYILFTGMSAELRHYQNKQLEKLNVPVEDNKLIQAFEENEFRKYNIKYNFLCNDSI
eukprot:UN31820